MSFVRDSKAFIVHANPADPAGAVVIDGALGAAVRSRASNIVMPS